jgi:hypothetical protein
MAEEEHSGVGIGKRRLSLRLGGDRDASDKKQKGDHGRGSRSKDRVPEGRRQLSESDQGVEQGASTAESPSLAPRSSSSGSSSCEEDTARTVRRSSRRSSFAPPAQVTSSSGRSRTSIVPTWKTAELETAPTTQSSSSSRSSARPPMHSHPSNISSRMPSPPGFSLSTGQPLVNPPLKTQAAFVGKLYSMLEDEDISKTGLIHWSNDGTTFTCPNPTEFSRSADLTPC